jgi:hypothetical protein
VGALGDLGGLLHGAGQALIRGLIAGAKSMVQAAIDAIKSALGSIVAGAKAALGIHSPSTVFAELGRQSMAGYLQGLNLGIPRVGAPAWSLDALTPLLVAPAAAASPSGAVSLGGPVTLSDRSVRALGEVVSEQIIRALGLSGATTGRVSDLYTRGG